MTCYQACAELFHLNCLDYRLFPLPKNITSSRDTNTVPTDSIESHAIDEEAKAPIQDTNAEIKSLGTHCYLRKKPDFWDQVDATTCDRLYPTVISTNHSNNLSQPHSPILILTRNPLPSLPNFTLFFSGIPGTVRFTQGASFEVGDDRLEDLHLYTIRICRAIANKPFVCPLKKMQYFFAPLGSTWEAPPYSSSQNGSYPNVVNHIPWDLVALAANSWVVPLASRNLQSITKDVEDAVIQDRWVEFTRRYDVVRMRPDLTPMNKPLDSPVSHCYSFLNRPNLFSA
jgi:endoribonuclease Dicer